MCIWSIWDYRCELLCNAYLLFQFSSQVYYSIDIILCHWLFIEATALKYTSVSLLFQLLLLLLLLCFLFMETNIFLQHSRDMSPMWRPNRFGRVRGCNESFRAAVDRSYDALDPALMDTCKLQFLWKLSKQVVLFPQSNAGVGSCLMFSCDLKKKTL